MASDPGLKATYYSLFLQCSSFVFIFFPDSTAHILLHMDQIVMILISLRINIA